MVPFQNCVWQPTHLYSRWQLLLRINISLSIAVLLLVKLQLHSNEYHNLYSGFFWEVFLSADLYRLCIYWENPFFIDHWRKYRATLQKCNLNSPWPCHWHVICVSFRNSTWTTDRLCYTVGWNFKYQKQHVWWNC